MSGREKAKAGRSRPPFRKRGKKTTKKPQRSGREKAPTEETRPAPAREPYQGPASKIKRDAEFERGQERENFNPDDPTPPAPIQPKEAPKQPPGSIAVAEAQVRDNARNGRPPQLTPEIHAAVMLARSLGQPETRIGPLIHLDRSIVGKWKDRGREATKNWAGLTPEQQEAERPYVDFFDGLIAAMPKFEISCLAIMHAAKNAGDARIADRLLQMHFPEYRTRVALTGGDPEDPPVQTQEVGAMTDEQRIARAKKAREILDAMGDT